MRVRIWEQASRGVGVGVACLALLMATASLLPGQEKSSAEAGKVSGSAEPVKRDYRFEVASIWPSDPPNGREYLTEPLGPSYTPGRYRESKVSFAVLAMMAFRAKHNFEIEYPHWMNSTYFTVNATLPEGATKADVPIMIQHLLEDRFGLVFHHEMRRVSGYELVVAKSGPRLAKSAGPGPDKSAGKSPSAAKPSLPWGPGIEFKNGVPQFTKDAGSGELWHGSTVMWRGRNETMKRLAAGLADKLGAPVMDATGLEGEYDYMLTYTAEATTSLVNVVSPLPMGGVPGPAAGAAGTAWSKATVGWECSRRCCGAGQREESSDRELTTV